MTDAEYMRLWRKVNPDKAYEISRRYRERHREEINAAQRERMHNMTPEQREAYNAAQRERMHNMTPEQREAYNAAQRERLHNLTPEQRLAYRERAAINFLRRQGYTVTNNNKEE